MKREYPGLWKHWPWRFRVLRRLEIIWWRMKKIGGAE